VSVTVWSQARPVLYLARIAALCLQVLLGADDEEASSLVDAAKALEIDVAAIHNVDAPGLARHAARLGATMNVLARVTGFDAVCQMVETGAGIAIVPEASAARCRRTMKIDVVNLRDQWASRQLAICVKRHRRLPIGAQRLVEHLRGASSQSRG